MHNPIPNDEYLPGPHVRKRYKISVPTLWRWQQDPALGFPKPTRIRKRTFFKIAELDVIDAVLALAIERSQCKLQGVFREFLPLSLGELDGMTFPCINYCAQIPC